MKFYIKYLILAVIVAAGGFFTQKMCYRFPTEQEMRDYHEGHYSTEVVSMTSELKGKNDDGVEMITFNAKHTNGQGFTESYNVEAGKAWVFPWETYWESRARMKDKE